MFKYFYFVISYYYILWNDILVLGDVEFVSLVFWVVCFWWLVSGGIVLMFWEDWGIGCGWGVWVVVGMWLLDGVRVFFCFCFEFYGNFCLVYCLDDCGLLFVCCIECV